MRKSIARDISAELSAWRRKACLRRPLALAAPCFWGAVLLILSAALSRVLP
jgi:hypothetical protein